jgi:MFS transporter, DHA1 family, multidrug resistance protein
VFHAFGVPLLLPLAVLPIMATAFGVALVFPILTLALLDMYPRQRGGASSAQAFIGLVLNSIVAGIIAPLVAPKGEHAAYDGVFLALTAAAFTLAGWLLWRGYASHHAKFPQVPEESAALEPNDEM